MFDIGWSEMALIMAVALVVIGPKDLPKLAREIGKWTGKARAMAREFQRSLDDMAREAELQDIKAEIDKVSRRDFGAELEQAVDPDGDLRRTLEPPRFPDVDAPATTTAEAADKALANAGEPPAIPPPASVPPPAPALAASSSDKA